MAVRLKKVSGKADVILVEADEVAIKDAGSALDIAVNVLYQFDSNRIIVRKETVCEDFFKLSTRIAGEILQKFVNYGVKMAIVGDFSSYTSKSLRDFIYESNNGKHFFFVNSIEEAVKKLENAGR